MLAASGRVLAEHPGFGRYPPPEPVSPDEVQVAVVSAQLTTRSGATLNLRDVIGDRIAVVDFIFTSCTTICPINSQILSVVQDALGPRLGSDVVLVSISTDPETDSPERLAEFAARYGARGGWTFLTGDPASVERVLGGFRAFTDDPADHPSFILVGRMGDPVWRSLRDFPAPEDILRAIDEVAAA